jgi:hypothetical protein
MALFSVAREYADAATELLRIATARPQIRGTLMPLSRPIYFLFGHAAELLFKAFLRAKDAPVREVHGLIDLYEDCRNRGLVIVPEDRYGVGNIVSLLASGNKRHGFRYFELQTTTIPELSWTRDTIRALIQAVEPHIQNTIATPGGQMTITVSKPEQKPRPWR